jgi:hypothetical protein
MKLSLKVKKLQLSCAWLGSFAGFGRAVGFERQANVPMQWRLKMRRVGHYFVQRCFIFQSPSCHKAVTLSAWEIFVNGVSPIG